MVFEDGKPPQVMFLRMQPAKDADGDYYRVNSAFPVSKNRFIGRDGFEKLWDGSEPASPATGTQADFVATPGDESSPGRLSAVRQSRTQSTTAKRARIERAIARETAKWGKNQPAVEIVSTPEDLPDPAKTDPGYRRAEGYYDGHTVWLVATNLTSVKRVRAVLAHEAVGHYGVDRIMRDAYGRDGWAKTVASVQRLDREGLGGKKMQAVLTDVHRRYPNADPETFAKETLATMAEKGVKNGILDRVVAAIRQYLRKIMPNLKLSSAELRQLLVKSDRYLRTPDDPDYRAQVAMVAAHAFDMKPDTFYSALAEAVNKAKGAPKKADAATWEQWLDGAQRRGEFKKAEREWMGLDAWLDQHKGPITRAELNEFVRDNQVQVHEVVHDEPDIDRAPDIVENEDGGFDIVDEDGTTGNTRFDEYTLPGGANYKELLLTLPAKQAPQAKENTDGWYVKTVRANPYTDQREIKVFDASGRLRGQRSGYRGDNQQAIDDYARKQQMLAILDAEKRSISGPATSTNPTFSRMCDLTIAPDRTARRSCTWRKYRVTGTSRGVNRVTRCRVRSGRCAAKPWASTPKSLKVKTMPKPRCVDCMKRIRKNPSR